MNSPSMTVHDVALYLNVDEKTVYRLAQRSELLGSRLPGRGVSRRATSTSGSSVRSSPHVTSSVYRRRPTARGGRA